MTTTGAAEVAMAARMLARMGFVHAFGHVSGRGPRGVLLTPTSPPLGTLDPADVLELDRAGGVLRRLAAHRPLEAPMHLAIYERREDVGAVCRIHSPATAAWACTGRPPPLLHGFGGIVEPVTVWDDPDLVASEQVAAEAAGTLGEAPALLLRGNGALTVGATLDQALARAWCLEDRCRIALALQAGDRAGPPLLPAPSPAEVPAAAPSGARQVRPFTTDELDRRRRWYEVEEARLARWLRQTFPG